MTNPVAQVKGQVVRQSDDKFRFLVNGVQDYAIFMLDPKGIVTTWNEGAELMKGYCAGEIIGEHFSRLHPAESVAAGYPSLGLKIASERKRFESEGWRVRKDGTRFWANVLISAVRDEDNILLGFSKVTRDMTQRMLSESGLRALAERLSMATNTAKLGVWEWDLASSKVHWDETMTDLYGLEPFHLITYQTWAQAVHPDDREATEALLQTIINEKSSGVFEFRIIRPDGSVRHISAACRIVCHGSQVARVIGINTDLTATKLAEAQLQRREEQMIHLIHHDSLTGLPNRTLLLDRLNRAIKLASRNAKSLGVLFLDLDGFKQVNDSLGHAIGDKLLKSVALRLESCSRASDTVSRHSGDEFVVLLNELHTPDDAAFAAERILQTLSDVHSISHRDLEITASIGITLYPDHGLDAKALIKNADTAMYRAKKGGRNTYKFFEAGMTGQEVGNV